MSDPNPTEPAVAEYRASLDPYAAGLPGRDLMGRFAKGNPGRTAGSRNRMASQVVWALLEDFQRHEADNLARMRRWFFPDYLRAVTRLLPRETAAPAPAAETPGAGANGAVAAGPTAGDTDAEDVLILARGLLDLIDERKATLADLRAVLDRAALPSELASPSDPPRSDISAP